MKLHLICLKRIIIALKAVFYFLFFACKANRNDTTSLLRIAELAVAAATSRV
jgi:hypothetical protein